MPEPKQLENGYTVYASVASGGLVLSRFDASGLPSGPGFVRPSIKLPPAANLALHPSGKYLYAATGFDVKKDGYSYDAFTDHKAIPQRLSTDLIVFSIQPNGELEEKQHLSIPGVLSGLVAHPKGRFLYGVGSGGGPPGSIGPYSNMARAGDKFPDPGGLPIFAIADNGCLRMTGRTEALYTFLMMDMSGERDGYTLEFSQDGRYAYSYYGGGFIDHSENYLQKFEVLRDGHFRPAGSHARSAKQLDVAIARTYARRRLDRSKRQMGRCLELFGPLVVCNRPRWGRCIRQQRGRNASGQPGLQKRGSGVTSGSWRPSTREGDL